ncbi:hypothetical protein LCGC14_0860350 [marine sediment metagenome]|uniref:Uncharacterized protein n=1 Tax=marine sediment metagenome TaxID=412755 RepID=A0A0F9PT07_9ZZZZ
MGVFNDKQILGCGEYDGVTNALGNYDVAGKVLGDGTHLFQTFAACMIHDVVITLLDVAFTDPGADRHIGYVLNYTLDNSTYVTLRTQIAVADTPIIWDDSAGTLPDVSDGVPIFMFDFKGNGSATGHTGTNKFGGNNAAPAVRCPANALVKLTIGTYAAGTLAATTGLDNLQASVIGMHVGS